MEAGAPRPDDDSLPATRAELRSTRRWLAVAGVWAVAATALGVFALIEANQEDEAARTQASGELGRVQRALNDRIDELESRIDELPTSDDLRRLENRINDLEDSADQAGTTAERLGNRLDDLEGRVDDLEQAAEQQTETTTAP
jgi:septal ring factor EnvC (AmiA/AmiB activator)